MTERKAKTSTFTIHHDQCDTEKWTAKDVLALAKFIRTGNLSYAAHLSRLGMQLITSDTLAGWNPRTMELVGFAKMEGSDGYAEIDEIAADEDVTQITRVYRGRVEYAVRIPVGNPNGDFEGYEYEICPTEESALKYLKDTDL